MRDASKKKPASHGEDAGELDGPFMTAIKAGELSLLCPSGEINLWADVLDYLVAQLHPRTVAAIQEAIERQPRSIAQLLAIADRHDARHDPVAAYFGWLHPARYDSAGRCVGPALDWRNIYGAASRHDAAILPVDDEETMAALGLCRASRSDRDRRVRHLFWWRLH